MLKTAIAKTVAFCVARPWSVIGAWVVLAVAAGLYTSQHFAINTDIGKLIATDVAWQQREQAYRQAFPHQSESILVVLDAPSPEQVTEAAGELTKQLKEKDSLYKSVAQMSASPFFAKNGLLFLPTDQLKGMSQQLTTAAPLIQLLVNDPSLGGLTDALTFATKGISMGRVTLDGFAPTLTMASDTIEHVFAGQPATFSWQTLMKGGAADASDKRAFVEVTPKLDFQALQPGKAASEAIRQAATDLGLAQKYGARVRLTGAVPIADDEFGSLQEGAVANGIGTVIIVLVILWMALRSKRIILAVFINLLVGLSVTAALGLMMVGTLNLISVAFAVLFVGLGVDFGIQYAVRYRAERHERDGEPDALRRALIAAAKRAGPQLTLAAGAVAAGFLSFLPTAYRGVSELGQIAGVGMGVAFISSVTILPALMMVFKPSGESKEIGYKSLAPVDEFLDRNRIAVLVGTILVVVAGLPALFYLRFDFNPMNLRNPSSESIQTYMELRQDPQTSGNGIEMLTRSQPEADALAKRLLALPQVGEVQTLRSFVPDDQNAKLSIVDGLKQSLGPKLEPHPGEPPTDAENVQSLRDAADNLTKIAKGKTGPGATAAQRLAADFVKLADAAPEMRTTTEAAFIVPFQMALQGLRGALGAERISLDTLPPELARQWTAPDGRLRVEAQPKGDINATDALSSFARAVLSVDADAVGPPVSILESGKTIVSAFIQAGLWAILSIAILLWIVLRRIGDVLLTLIPLLTAGIVTLELTVLIGMPLNFANIIALPLLLGLGVAFKIYYIMAWRSGQTNLLQTSLTRAVIYSAMTTATAFGSLWLSSHPGTSSMGKLLALSLLCTLAAAVLFQPVLMGKPRDVSPDLAPKA